MNYIGEKVSYQKQDGIFTLVISPKIVRIKETLLLTWLLAWTFCGLFFVAQLFGPETRETKLTIGVLVAFWAYFELRVGKAYLWRKHGLERLMIKEGYLSIKNDIKGYGKAKVYDIENINRLSKIDTSSKNFFNFMNQSFWVIGGETIQFEYLGKPVAFAQHLSDRDAKKLIGILQNELKVSRKSLKQKRDSY